MLQEAVLIMSSVGFIGDTNSTPHGTVFYALL